MYGYLMVICFLILVGYVYHAKGFIPRRIHISNILRPTFVYSSWTTTHVFDLHELYMVLPTFAPHLDNKNTFKRAHVSCDIRTKLQHTSYLYI
jgi:hypothetical protein